jgi:DNA-binding response OmpR family regulator
MKKILIIEDDQIVANIYRNKFSVEGYQVEIAMDGEAGLATARSFQPDAILLDLMLPKITGVELMKKIRSEPGLEQLPVVVFSNTYLTNMVQDAWKAGATKCLSKANCSPKQVIDVVRGVINTGHVNGAGPKVNGNGHAKPAVAEMSPVPIAQNVCRQTAPAPQPAQGEAVDANHADIEFQADLRKEFVDNLPATLINMRNLLKAMTKADSEVARLKQVHELYRRVHAVTSNAGITGLSQIAQMSDALEALLKELYEKPKNLNASSVRTVASAIDFLGVLFDQGDLSGQQMSEPRILVVDDEAISRRAVTYALEKAKLKSVSVEDPRVAYDRLMEQRFDLVFLDVDMPGMSGFELCAKLRSLQTHRKTPVVFVTSLDGFETRANSTMSGGNDFIAKPFLFIELAVKALVHVLRARLPAAALAA